MGWKPKQKIKGNSFASKKKFKKKRGALKLQAEWFGFCCAREPSVGWGSIR